MYTQSIRIYYNILHEVIYSIIDVINIIKKKIIEFYLRYLHNVIWMIKSFSID